MCQEDAFVSIDGAYSRSFLLHWRSLLMLIIFQVLPIFWRRSSSRNNFPENLKQHFTDLETETNRCAMASRSARLASCAGNRSNNLQPPQVSWVSKRLIILLEAVKTHHHLNLEIEFVMMSHKRHSCHTLGILFNGESKCQSHSTWVFMDPHISRGLATEAPFHPLDVIFIDHVLKKCLSLKHVCPA